MAANEIEGLPLYPEGRACRRPTARKVIDLFEDVQRHTLIAEGQTGVIFTTELTRLKPKVLRLLGMSQAYDGGLDIEPESRRQSTGAEWRAESKSGVVRSSARLFGEHAMRLHRATTIVVALLVSAITESRALAQADNEEQERAITAIRELGGKVERDERVAGMPVVSIAILSRSNEAVRHLKLFPKLRTLIARFGNLSDDDLKHLEGLTSLEALNLDYNMITDAGLTHLKGLKNLRLLVLGGNAVTNAALVHLKGLSRLRALRLNETRVSDEGLAELGALPDLQELQLMGCEITDTGLRVLKGMGNLRVLNLAGTQVSDVGVEDLANEGAPALRSLWLTSTRITDAGLGHLGRLSQLEELMINDNTITDAGLASLEGLTALKRLSVARSQVTDAGIERIRRALPKLTIIR